ncbi:MAG: phosphate regulon sensor histidine kinase PhoR [Pseudomonadota bacterium]
MFQAELFRVVLAMAAGAIPGAYASDVAAGVAIGLLLLVAWHGRQAARLVRGMRDPKRRMPGAAGFWQFLGERVFRATDQAEDAASSLQQYKDSVSAVSTVFPEPLMLLDENLAIRWCNSAAEAMVGCDENSCAGRRLRDVIRHPLLAEYLDGDKQDSAVEISAPADKSRLLSVRLFPFGDSGGRLFVARDVTRVYNLDAVRRDFVANVSHELRTPLTVIGGYLEPLGDVLGHDADWAHHVALMKQQADRMEALIRDLTVLSRLESEKEQSADETVIDLHELVSAIVDEAAAVSGDDLHDIYLNFARGPALLGDQQEIRSAVSNLVFNAVKHTDPRTRIDIDWQRDENGARLIVRDSGKGIAARHLPRLTERFYRADSARSRASGGTGLGLAIVKHTLNRHDGELLVDSQVGVGTAFTCIFPVDRVRELALDSETVQPSVS